MTNPAERKQRDLLRQVTRAAAINWIARSQEHSVAQVKALNDAGEIIPDITQVSNAVTRGLLAAQRLRERREKAEQESK